MASDFKILEEQIAPHHVGNRTESTAMLAWFLEHAWRYEPDEVEAALCDGGNDKGIDAITVDRDAREITVFQGKRRRTAGKTQGESDLQKFRAVATYFRGPDGIDDLLAAAPNPELKKLVHRLDLTALLDEAERWSVNLVYVTNAKLDASATSSFTRRATMCRPSKSGRARRSLGRTTNGTPRSFEREVHVSSTLRRGHRRA